MQNFPKPIPGADLLALRKEQRVAQQDLAARMSMHRTSLYDIETAPEVAPIVAARYVAALKEIVDEALAAAGKGTAA